MDDTTLYGNSLMVFLLSPYSRLSSDSCTSTLVRTNVCTVSEHKLRHHLSKHFSVSYYVNVYGDHLVGLALPRLAIKP